MKIILVVNDCVCVISSGYRSLTGVREVFVMLLVDCQENVVNLVWIPRSWTYYMQTRGVGWTWWVGCMDITGFLDSTVKTISD